MAEPSVAKPGEPPVDASPEGARDTALSSQDTAKPKYQRPPVIGDRGRPRGDNAEMEMIGQLGIQAQEILQFALRVEGGNTFRNFQDYLAFRDKISEFEAFCNVIEGHLKEMVVDRRKELEDRFYSLWSMIFRPSLHALMKFFDRISEEQVLPLGGRDLLESELRALRSMRQVLSAPRFAALADKQMMVDLNWLEGVVSKLAERATSLPDFSKRAAPEAMPPAANETASVPPPRSAPTPPPQPAATASATPTIGEPPNLKAVRELKGLLDYYRRDVTLRQYVDIDTRAVDEIERKLVANPMDPAAIVWMRQICNAWASRLRMDEKDKDIRRVLATIRSH